MYNTLDTSLTLGCGTTGKNITTDNITARHLVNVQRITRRRLNEQYHVLDPILLLVESVDASALTTRYNLNFYEGTCL